MKNYACCIDWLEDVMRVLDKKVVAGFFTTLWNTWNNRNNHIFSSKEDEARVWKKPQCRFVKVNFDASVAPNKTGYGMVARDEDGFVIGGGGDLKEEALTVEWAKIYAFEESLKLARTLNISKALFETEASFFIASEMGSYM
ncbi:hypothetical protein Gotri_028084 [Gossypium trilobum]|uniref:RNase H type-1 domain-containing protein n=1 Tax=Gossypium trilobum TaxID=34281 RepID=A0A7J9FTF9_9ROSI|nr:hypothetical protein [Gossypium trilobum]